MRKWRKEFTGSGRWSDVRRKKELNDVKKKRRKIQEVPKQQKKKSLKISSNNISEISILCSKNTLAARQYSLFLFTIILWISKNYSKMLWKLTLNEVTLQKFLEIFHNGVIIIMHSMKLKISSILQVEKSTEWMKMSANYRRTIRRWRSWELRIFGMFPLIVIFAANVVLLLAIYHSMSIF